MASSDVTENKPTKTKEGKRMKYIHNTEAYGEFEFECDSLAEFISEIEDIVLTHDHIKMPDSIEIEGNNIIGWYDGYKETIGELIYEVHISWTFPDHCYIWVSSADGLEVPDFLTEKRMVFPCRTGNGRKVLPSRKLKKEAKHWMRREHPGKEFRIVVESMYAIPPKMIA